MDERTRNFLIEGHDRAVSEIDGLFETMMRKLPQWGGKIGHNRIGEFDQIQQYMYRGLADYNVYGRAKLKEMEHFRRTGEWVEPAPEPPQAYPEKTKEADVNSL
jgi:hypothetical protein